MKRRLLALFAVVLLAQLVPTPADAHSTSSTIPFRWYESQVNLYWSGNPNWWHTIPDIADRVVESMVTWNNSPASLHMGSLGDRAGLSESFCVGSQNENGIFWTALDGPMSLPGDAGDVIAEARVCAASGFPDRIKNAKLVFDGNEPNWSAGPGSPGVGNWDLRSIATHELGHVGGFFFATTENHWNGIDSDLCPNSSAIHTMCAGTTFMLGHTYFRTLGIHDSDTYNNRY